MAIKTQDSQVGDVVICGVTINVVNLDGLSLFATHATGSVR
jgi:hypothetical protein